MRSTKVNKSKYENTAELDICRNSSPTLYNNRISQLKLQRTCRIQINVTQLNLLWQLGSKHEMD